MSVIVAIVGRPNSGKSTLFNRMRGKRHRSSASAIIEETPGVTRDRNYGEAVWEGHHFTVIDTGGFFLGDEMAEAVEEQAMLAVQEADVIVHLLDGKAGLNPADKELAGIVRRSGKKVLSIVNKIDNMAREKELTEFYSLGAEELMPVSSATGLGFDDFMDGVVSALKETCGEDFSTRSLSDSEEGLPRVAVVGRPNVGKSTLINCLLGKNRHIVSPVAGTTRDPVDSICTFYGRKYLFIDTAGIRNKARRGYSIEVFSVVRALKSIERADVALIVLDASKGVVEQDQRIAGIVEEYGKGALFILNKWDLVEDPEVEYKRAVMELKNRLWFMNFAPSVTTSGLMKKRITKVFPIIDEIMSERRKRIPTAELNRFLARAVQQKPFPLYRGRELKFKYITQVETEPPTFTLFVNYPAAVKDQYLRFLEKSMREAFSFKGTPVRIYVKSK
jgi:GTP-binding protein